MRNIHFILGLFLLETSCSLLNAPSDVQPGSQDTSSNSGGSTSSSSTTSSSGGGGATSSTTSEGGGNSSTTETGGSGGTGGSSSSSTGAGGGGGGCENGAPNGALELGEQCDDGNSNEQDACNSECEITQQMLPKPDNEKFLKPRIAPTSTGYVIVFQRNTTDTGQIMTAHLDADGNLSGSETMTPISNPDLPPEPLSIHAVRGDTGTILTVWTTAETNANLRIRPLGANGLTTTVAEYSIAVPNILNVALSEGGDEFAVAILQSATTNASLLFQKFDAQGLLTGSTVTLDDDNSDANSHIGIVGMGGDWIVTVNESSAQKHKGIICDAEGVELGQLSVTSEENFSSRASGVYLKDENVLRMAYEIQNDNGDFEVALSEYSEGNEFPTLTVPLDENAESGAQDVRARMVHYDDTGVSLVVWSHAKDIGGAVCDINFAIIDAVGSIISYGQANQIAQGCSTNPDVAIASDGTVAIVWQDVTLSQSYVSWTVYPKMLAPAN